MPPLRLEWKCIYLLLRSVNVSAEISQLNLLLAGDFIRMSIYDNYSGSIKITTHLDHIRHCKTASGTNVLNGWTY